MEPIKVLIIDREVEFASILTNHLNSWGFATSAAASGEEALAIMDQNFPEVVVLGIEAGVAEGFHTLEWIKTHHPGVEVILLAGKGAAVSAVNGIQRGAFDVLSLPIELGVLCETIRRARRGSITPSSSQLPT
ncbi:response regulator [Desulfobulbus propionicus]